MEAQFTANIYSHSHFIYTHNFHVFLFFQPIYVLILCSSFAIFFINFFFSSFSFLFLANFSFLDISKAMRLFIIVKRKDKRKRKQKKKERNFSLFMCKMRHVQLIILLFMWKIYESGENFLKLNCIEAHYYEEILLLQVFYYF